jgi:pSer/pThr/pTyr-binding forkhead associated (FHA) protein
MAQLRYIDDSDQLQTQTLDAEPCVIGRAPDCQIVLVDDTISREHVRIELDSGGRYRIRDLGSRNKTHVNGELINETLLNPGDVVRAGARVLEFLDDGAAPERIELDFLTPDKKEPPDCEWLKLKTTVALPLMQIEKLGSLVGHQRATGRPEDIADAALGRLILELQAERGLVALRGDDKFQLRPLAHRALRRPSGGSLKPVSQSFALAPVLQSVAGRYPKTAGQLNAKLGYAITAVVAPLTFRGDVIGILYVDRAAAKKPFTTADLQYVAASGAMIGASIAESTRRLAGSASREGAAWMTTLRRVQESLGNSVGETDAFSAQYKQYPGRARCGDFIDFVPIDELRCYAVLVDAGGHGITGLAQACAIRSALRAAIAVSEDALLDPAALFDEINQMVAASSARQVIPCTFIGIDLSAGRLSYVNAGAMSPMLMVAPGRLITLDRPSLVLGVDAEYAYETTLTDLPETFRVVCHTDGLPEATNASGEPLGSQRLHETLLDREAFTSTRDVLSRIDKTWSGHLAGAHPDDDALVFVLGRG